MKRRSFIKTIAGATAAVPIGGVLLNQSTFEEKNIAKTPLFQVQEGVDLTKKYRETKGIGCGVPAIDAITDGFVPPQVVCVHGPMNEINVAFILNVATHAALKHKKNVDYIVSEHRFEDYYQKMFGWMYPKSRSEIYVSLFESKGSSHRALLRLPDIDIGNPTNRGWKDYFESARTDPPGLLVLDGVELIEMLLNEKKMALQLKSLADQLDIPIVLQAPAKERRGRSDSTFLRKDFEGVYDVEIRFTPSYVCDVYDSGRRKGKYFALKTNVHVRSGRGSRQNERSAELRIQFNDSNMQFTELPKENT